MPRSRKTSLIIAGLIGLFLLSTAVTYTFGQMITQSLPLGSDLDTGSAEAAPLPTPPMELTQTVNVLILGYGGPGHPGGNLSDVNLIAHLNPDTKKLALIAIPRDTWVSYQGNTNKINTAYAAGPDSAKLAAQTVTNLPIHYYMAVDFVGFQRAIHALGGIQVDVQTVLDDPWYPVTGQEVNPCDHSPEEITRLSNTLSGFELEKQFPCRYEHLHFDPGLTFMEGGDALKFVRSRHTTSDFARGERAQLVLIGIKNKLLSLESVDNYPAFISELLTHITTDIDAGIIEKLIPSLRALGDLELTYINLTTENLLTSSTSSRGASILIPQAGIDQWQPTHQYIQSHLNSQ